MNLCFSGNQSKVIVETNKGCIVISMAMLCMIALGVGEVIGALIFSRVQDSCNKTVSLGVILAITIVACIVSIIYIIEFKFNIYICIAMTFTWGMQDASVICLLNTLCGFEFDSKTTPFSV